MGPSQHTTGVTSPSSKSPDQLSRFRFDRGLPLPGSRRGAATHASWHFSTLCLNIRKTDSIHHHHPDGVVYKSFCLNSSTFEVSTITSGRWWCTESVFPIALLVLDVSETRFLIARDLQLHFCHPSTHHATTATLSLLS